MSLTEKQKHELKKFIKQLESYKGSHTELVSVYIPQGYDMNKIINHLSQEQGTASNIKSAATRKNVISALERMIQHLRLFKKTPEHGLTVFAGNVSERPGQEDFQVWSIEPPVPLNTRIYRCDKQFQLELLREMLDSKEAYGLIVIDRRDANIALLKGKTIIHLLKTHSEVPGKIRAGGQCHVFGTLVQSATGSLVKIENCHNPIIVKSMIIDNYSIKDSPITDKWTTKKQEVYKIETKCPRLTVESSKDHLFFVSTDKGITEKPAEELREGDYLIMPERIDVKGKIQKLDSKQYYNSFIMNEEGRNILRKSREHKKLFQGQLAKRIGLVSQMSISMFESGKQHIMASHLQKLCKELDIDFTEFFEKYTIAYKYKDITLPNKLDEEFAQFLGYYMGDGCLETDRITFFEQDKQVALEYKHKSDKYFSVDSSYKFRQSKNYHQIRFTSRPLVRLIKNEFPEIKKTLDSEIPQKVLESPNNVIAAFLKGIFDAEGYVHINRGIFFGINNKTMAYQIQMILLRFSIISSIQEYDNRANQYSNNMRFTVDITEKKSMESFRDYIDFTSLTKKKKLKELLNKKSDTSYVRQVIVPGKKVREIIEKAGYNLQLFPKVSWFFLNKRMMSKQAFKSSILDNIKDKKLYRELEKIYYYPILPVKINRIEKEKKETKMADISVKDQNFIANGLITHNSAARYARLTEGAKKDHFKKVAEYVKEQFLTMEGLKGLIVGGPGPTKYEFAEGDYITNEIKKKIIAIKDLSYTGEFGVQEMVDKSQDVLAKEGIADEKKIMGKFFDVLAKTPNKASYGEADVMKNLQMGTVDTLLLSEALDDSKIEQFEEEAKKVSTNVQIISTETREGVQLKELGKIVAILRFEVHQE